MNLKYLVVFFFSGIAEWAEFQTQSQNFSGGNLLKDMWNPNKKIKHVHPFK